MASMQSTFRSKKDRLNDEEAEKVRALLQNKLYTTTVGHAFCSIARSPWKLAWKGARRQEANSAAPLAPGFNGEQLVNPVDTPEVQGSPGVDGPRLRRSASNPIMVLSGKERSKSEETVQSAFGRKSLVEASKYGAQVTANKIMKQKRAIERLSMQLYAEKLEDVPTLKSHVALPPVTALEPSGAKQGVADNFALRLLLLFDKLRELASARRGAVPDDDPFSTLELIIFFLSSVQTQMQLMQVSLLERS